MPHPNESDVDLVHDLRWFILPTQLKQLLPDMTSVTMNDCLRDAAKQLVNHDSSKVLRNTIESLLDDMTTKRVHAQSESVPTNCISNAYNLIRGSMFEAALNQKVTKAIDHQWICLLGDSIDDFVFLIDRPCLQLLLEKDRRLLVVATDNLVNDVLPVTRDILLQKATIVQWLGGRKVSLLRGIGQL